MAEASGMPEDAEDAAFLAERVAVGFGIEHGIHGCGVGDMA